MKSLNLEKDLFQFAKNIYIYARENYINTKVLVSDPKFLAFSIVLLFEDKIIKFEYLCGIGEDVIEVTLLNNYILATSIDYVDYNKFKDNLNTDKYFK